MSTYGLQHKLHDHMIHHKHQNLPSKVLLWYCTPKYAWIEHLNEGQCANFILVINICMYLCLPYFITFI